MWVGRDAARVVSGEAVDGVDGVVVRGGDDRVIGWIGSGAACGVSDRAAG
jgi:hypothetical protein